MLERLKKYLKDQLLTFFQSFRDQNLTSSRRKKIFISRVIIVSTVIAFIIANSITAVAIQAREVSCVWDWFFEITTKANEYFYGHDITRNIFVIVSSFLMDFLAVYSAVNFCL